MSRQAAATDWRADSEIDALMDSADNERHANYINLAGISQRF